MQTFIELKDGTKLFYNQNCNNCTKFCLDRIFLAPIRKYITSYELEWCANWENELFIENLKYDFSLSRYFHKE